MDSHDITIINYQREFAIEAVKMWRLSFQRAMGLEEHNRYSELAGHLAFISSMDPDNMRVAFDETASRIAGLMVLADHELEQLYVHVDYQGSGIGSRLLDEAKQRSPTSLELYTFQKNTRAQAFYCRHGFTEIARGYADPAENPWASSTAELADIRYQWTPGQPGS